MRLVRRRPVARGTPALIRSLIYVEEHLVEPRAAPPTTPFHRQSRRDRHRSRIGETGSHQCARRPLRRAISIDADARATRPVPPGDAEEERLEQRRTRRSTPALRLSRYFKPLRAATSYARMGRLSGCRRRRRRHQAVRAPRSAHRGSLAVRLKIRVWAAEQERKSHWELAGSRARRAIFSAS
jgi:hypothetical protein